MLVCVWVTQKPSADEKQTHRLFSIHGFHPHLSVPLTESLESDGHISTKTATDNSSVAVKWFSLEVHCRPFQHPTSVNIYTHTHTHTPKLGKKNKSESLRGHKNKDSEHLWSILLNPMCEKWEINVTKWWWHSIVTIGLWERQQNSMQKSAAQRQINQFFTDTRCVKRLKLAAKCTN